MVHLAGNTLLGSSRSLRDGRTVGFEFMQLRQHDDGRLVLTALPSGQNATDFNATRVDANEAVFENRPTTSAAHPLSTPR